MKLVAAQATLPAKNATNITLCLREEIQLRMARRWILEHADFLAAYNRRVGEDGVALEEWRSF